MAKAAKSTASFGRRNVTILKNEKVVRDMGMLRKGSTVAIVACSNVLSKEQFGQVGKAAQMLLEMGLRTKIAPYMYGEEKNVPAKVRAAVLMEYFMDSGVQAIFDASGGDVANEVLEHLDFAAISKASKPFFGYSDLTVLLNALYAKMGNVSYYYQLRNLAGEKGKEQQEWFYQTLLEGKNTLFDIGFEFVQGERVQGIVLGGNMRCMLKLAGTPYWPDMDGKILLLESWGGRMELVRAWAAQYRQMGVFEQVKGIILGTFSHIEKQGQLSELYKVVQENAGELPIVKTNEIGHGQDARCIAIGGEVDVSFY
ncbi:LD-carboxypeptidase [Clostridia bacterium OttesenSCG-928-F22]|nr:LD-carboxypeptidase [Clostridia bacterium OttesenSCG-928-F22]